MVAGYRAAARAVPVSITAPSIRSSAIINKTWIASICCWRANQPLLADFVEERSDVGVQYPVHLRALDPDNERIQCAAGGGIATGNPDDTHRLLMASDPVGVGIVESLARPGGNATGFFSLEPSMGGKWLELLKEIVPGLRRVAVVFNPDSGPAGTSYLHSIENAAASFSVSAIEIPVHDTADIERAINSLDTIWWRPNRATGRLHHFAPQTNH